MSDVAVIVNLHREGRLAHPTFRSLARGVEQAISDGLTVEVVLVLDRPDDSTREFVVAALAPGGSLSGLPTAGTIEVDNGDLGLSRNDGVASTAARNICVLDADNLITSSWLTQAARFLDEQAETVVAHPALFVMFGSRERLAGGQECVLWAPWDSRAPGFRLDARYEGGAYWDAFCMAPREVFVAHPYARTRAGSQLGPEDWHWNFETLIDGIHHVTVPGSGFYYRLKSEASLGATAPALLLPRTGLLTSRELASKSPVELPDPEPPKPVPRDVLPELVALALEDFDLGAGARGGAVDFRGFKRRGSPGLRTWWALRPKRFNAAHYRLLNPDLHGLTYGHLVRHWLDQGRAEGRSGRLTTDEIDSLRRAAFDPVDYRMLHPDLHAMTNLQATSHFLKFGVKERRRTFPADARRDYLESLFDSVRDDWLQTHQLEPQLPPPPLHFSNAAWGDAEAGSGGRFPASWVYWSAVRALPEPVDAVFVAPRVSEGHADQTLIRYLAAVRALRPQWSVVLFTTDRRRSTHLDTLPDGVTVVELGPMMKQARLRSADRERLLATLVLQFGPRILHVFDSDLGFDVVERFGRALAIDTRVFLTTFRIEIDPNRNNAMSSPLLRRKPDFLDSVTAVIVDHEEIARRVNDITAAGADKFVVHHQGAHPFDHPRVEADSNRRKILWAGPFDHHTRLDVLAEVAEALTSAGVDAEVHFYGQEVTQGLDLADDLARLEAAGAVHHAAVVGNIRSLPLGDFALFLITCESEGIPLHLLDVVSAGVPVVAPATGGVPDVLTPESGFLTSGTEAIDEYLTHIKAVLNDPQSAQERANTARKHLETEFSQAAFEQRVAALPGYLSQ